MNTNNSIKVASTLAQRHDDQEKATIGSKVLVNVGENLYKWGIIIKVLSSTTAQINFDDSLDDGENFDTSRITLVVGD